MRFCYKDEHKQQDYDKSLRGGNPSDGDDCSLPGQVAEQTTSRGSRLVYLGTVRLTAEEQMSEQAASAVE